MAKFKIDKSYQSKTKSFIKDVISKLSDESGELENDWIASVHMLADNYDTFIIASDDVKKNGITIKDRFGSTIANPALKIRNDANIQMLKLLLEFGLTKKSAKKVDDGQVEDDSPLIAFVKSNKKEKR